MSECGYFVSIWRKGYRGQLLWIVMNQQEPTPTNSCLLGTTSTTKQLIICHCDVTATTTTNKRLLLGTKYTTNI